MSPWLRRFIVVLTALGFVGGGFARVTLALAPGEPCHTHHQSVEPSGHVDAEQDAHAGHHQHEQGGPSAPIESACFKCCGICTVAPTLPFAKTPSEIGFGYLIAYFIAAENYADRPLVIDPGIPKRIA